VGDKTKDVLALYCTDSCVESAPKLKIIWKKLQRSCQRSHQI